MILGHLRSPTIGVHLIGSDDDFWDEDEDDDDDDDEEREAILAAHVGLFGYPQKIPDEDAFDAFRYGVKAFLARTRMPTSSATPL